MLISCIFCLSSPLQYIVYDGRKTTYTDFESAFKKIGYSVKKVKK